MSDMKSKLETSVYYKFVEIYISNCLVANVGSTGILVYMLLPQNQHLI